MRARTATAFVVLVAVLLGGCGGGSAAAGAANRGSTGFEEEAGGLIEVEGPEPEGELVAGDEGWVRSSIGVFWTPDGGRTWRQITPPVPDGAALENVYFADPRRGWALSERGREGDVHPSMYSTSDGGRTWRRIRLRAYKLFMPAVEVSFSLVDGHELFALVRQAGDTASSFGTLLVSRDAGRHWRALPTPPHAGQISFETPRRGWLVGRSPGRGLWRTADGGHTWDEVEPGKPLVPWPPKQPAPGPHESPPPESGLDEFRWVDYTLPLIGPGGHGILGMVESTGEGIEERGPTRTTVWQTGDYGRSWHRSSRIHLPNTTGSLEATQIFTRRGRSRSFLVHDPRDTVYTVVRLDGRPGPLRPSHGLPPFSDGLSFSYTRHGLALPGFRNPSTLSFTADGGRNWTQVPVPRAPQ